MFTRILTHHGHFYPRSPCGERLGRFGRFAVNSPHFYPRSPCGERPTKSDQGASSHGISIHALLAESDDNKPTQRAG